MCFARAANERNFARAHDGRVKYFMIIFEHPISIET